MLNRILSSLGYEKRDTYDPRLAPDAWNRPTPPAGFVSPRAVFSQLPTAVRCVSLRSELLAGVPLKMYRRTPEGDRVRVNDHPLADVLADLANPRTTAFEAREYLVRSLDTAGNAYAVLEHDTAGQVSAMWPVEPGKVQVEQLETGRLRYRVNGAHGPKYYLQESFLHIRSASDDGVVGVSPLSRARAALGLAISQNETAGTLSASGLRIAGVMSHPGKLSERAKDNIRESIEARHAGPLRAGRVMIAEEGMRFTPTQFSASDAELLESRKLSDEAVCRIFGVPPASVGISTSVSYGSAQQAAADLVQNALAPLASRIEQALQRCCLTPHGRRNYIIEHDLSGLLRGDATARWAAYEKARIIGVMSAGEIRRVENLGPFDPSQDYTPLKAAPAQAEPPIATTKP